MMKKILLFSALIMTSVLASAQCGVDSVMFVVEINPDNYPNEISWTVQDPDFNVVLSGGSVSDSVCVAADDCMTFDINDSYGDGICCSYGIGSYVLYVDGAEVATGGDYGTGETVSVNCPPGFSCNQAVDIDQGTHVAAGGDSWYTYTPDVNGSYFITTCGQNNTCNTKIWMYEYCNMGSFAEDNTATVYYDNDQGGCGDQAQLNVALLEGGVQYWIRIGDSANDCAGTDIMWSLGYNGPIEGCTDVSACNYNPLASVDDNSCIPIGDPTCPFGPDLMVLSSVISSSLSLQTMTAEDGNCYVPEGCLNGYGLRDILRFTTHIKNIGQTDYYIGSPSANPDQFDTENCHNHTHYKGYAEYLLFGLDGTEIPIGFKNGFCVLDLECSDGGSAQYGCSNMGISAQCGDIYSSGLACQWIDITDTPDGIYTMVVRTNWDQDPDALGRHELDYNNNWGQVCIQLDRSSGSLVVDEVLDCDPFIDCAGNIYGSAQPDCTGECNGTALSGDADGDNVRAMADATEYVALLCDDEMVMSPCVDLDGDGAVSVSDAAAMVDCIITEENHVHPPGELDIIEECVFPVTMPTNIFDEIVFTISDIDLANGYFDVSVRNPLTKLLGYELVFTGPSITSVSNLVVDPTVAILHESGLAGNRVIGLSYDDTPLSKNTDFVPLVRVNFSGSPASICLTEVVDIVNDVYENGVGVVLDPCGECAPDVTGDGVVDINDFLDLNTAFGSTCVACAADIDGSGLVDVNDFLMLNSAFGSSCSYDIGTPDEERTLIQELASRPDIQIDPAILKVIQNLSAERPLILFPNPNRGDRIQFALDGIERSENSIAQLHVLDISGKRIQSEQVVLNATTSTSVDFDNVLPSGSYFVELTLDGKSNREKFVVVK